MTRLLRAELRRFRSRRLVIVALLVAVAGVGLITWGTWQTARPLTGGALAAAQSNYDAAVRDWEENGEEIMAGCLEEQERVREAEGDPTLDFGCETMEPQREWYFPEPVTFVDSSRLALSGTAYLLAFAALLAGTTGTAADLSSGGTSTWLTFEPRRGRVYTSKLSAIGLSLVLPTVLLVAASVAGLMLLYRSGGLGTALTGDQTGDLASMAARVLALVVAAGVAGAALGMVMRHTAAVLGAVVGYLVAVEAVLGNAWSTARPWMVLTNIEAWLDGPASYYVTTCTSTAQGTSCDWVEREVSTGHGAVYLAVLVVVAVVLGLLTFRRRDAA
ncbi:ABC transporter permease subunit [Actinotalea sp.]|uniref:ABC transporter permease subunit n=1 Tax=Actinotalea sp. TaxID=1872145 RepID=UPI00356939A7